MSDQCSFTVGMRSSPEESHKLVGPVDPAEVEETAVKVVKEPVCSIENQCKILLEIQ